MTDRAPLVVHADAVAGLRSLANGSVDAVITDPPYAEVDRHYGRLTEAQWRALMDGVVPEVQRVLKPQGSAVFILQPNSERIGRMRPWLFRWIADMAEQWNLIQDAYWWNHSAMPSGGATHHGLLRGSVKPCVWLGSPSAYRNQNEVLWAISDSHLAKNVSDRSLHKFPSGRTMNYGKALEASLRRGGTTPFNLLPFATVPCGDRSAAARGHGAGTPYHLAAWWVRYICPPGGLVVDPFAGSGTMGWAALDQGRRWYGCDSDPQWARPDGATEPAQALLFGGAA